MNQSSITDSIQRLADRTATARGGHAVLLGIRSDDGQTEIRTAAGAAKPDDTFYVASVSKMFTAAIVLGLIDEGELRRTSRLVDLLPHHDLAGLHVLDGVDHTSEVGLGHLLDQTSGLPDYFAGSPALQDDLKQNRDRHYGVSDVLDMVRGTPASFPPGDRGGRRAAYSDTNYQLLTAIIEATTGTDYATAVAQRITAPLELDHTWVASDPSAGDRATPLVLRNGSADLAIPLALASEQGAGGVVSTVSDQLRFSAALHGGELFDPGHLAAVRWNRVFFPVDYGCGLMRYRLPRWMTGFRQAPELVGHSGATNSFTFHIPDLGWHVAGTLNQFDNPSRAFRLLSKVADLLRKA